MTAPRFTVLGLGNLLMSDEGVGVRVIERLERDFEAHPDVEIVDGGTAGIDLMYCVRKGGTLIIIDAVAPHKAPGNTIRLEDDAVPAFLDAKLSPHQIGLPDLLAASQLVGESPQKLVLVGIEPYSIDLGVTLSPQMHERLPELVSKVLFELERFGVKLRAKGSAL